LPSAAYAAARPDGVDVKVVLAGCEATFHMIGRPNLARRSVISFETRNVADQRVVINMMARTTSTVWLDAIEKGSRERLEIL